MTIKIGTDKCPYCEGKGYYYQESSYGMELIKCSCRQNKQTNEEWMKLLDTEDFAEAIFVFMNGVSKQINGEEITNKDVIINEVIIKWLKEKHNEM